jgi:hypothetical protein
MGTSLYGAVRRKMASATAVGPRRKVSGSPVSWLVALMTFGVGGVVGAVASHFLDPDRGHARRAQLRDRLGGGARHTVKHGTQAARRRVRYLGGRLEGARHHALSHHHALTEETDDALLVQRVRSEVLGRSEFARLGVTIDACGGTMTLRGEVPSLAVGDRLAVAVRVVPGIVDVANLLHEPGTPAPNKLAALRVR